MVLTIPQINGNFYTTNPNPLIKIFLQIAKLSLSPESALFCRLSLHYSQLIQTHHHPYPPPSTHMEKFFGSYI